MRPAPGAAPCVGDRRPDEQSQRRALRPGRGTAPSPAAGRADPRTQPTGTAVAFRSMGPDQVRRGGWPTNFPKTSAAAVAASTPGTIS